MILTEHSRPSHTFVHISDTHLPGERAPLYGSGADADANLASVLSRLVSSGLRPDALLFTGDLADRGDASSYRRLRELVAPAVETMQLLLSSDADSAPTVRQPFVGTLVPGSTAAAI